MSDPCEHLQCYLVGGAVRDALLDRPAGDRDWVVVGANPEQMEQRGFRAVGKDFPVFLHPTSGEQYALARRERKTGPGYRGFAINADPDVTLEEDLSRRDLTINAMAQNADGELIDPFDGIADLKAGILRHVSGAFVDDPLRVLRVARFAARYQNLGFTVAPETMDLMENICHSGEIDSLVAERVWQETCRALAEPAPAEFIRVLRACGALARVFPEIDALYDIPQRADFHPEGDALTHTLMVLDAAAQISADTKVRFAALVHDLGKGATPKDQWPRHIKHEHRGVRLVKALCQRLGVPNDHRDLAILVTGQHLLMHRLNELRPETVLKLLNRLDAFRRPERIESFVLACEADSQGRGNAPEGPYVPAQLLNEYFNAARKIDLSNLADSGLDGTARRNEVERRRTEAISSVRPNRTKAD